MQKTKVTAEYFLTSSGFSFFKASPSLGRVDFLILITSILREGWFEGDVELVNANT